MLPRSRRRGLYITTLALFALSLGGVALEFRSAIVLTEGRARIAGISAQLAAVPVAPLTKTPSPTEEECEQGYVHMIKQEKIGAKPVPTKSQCFKANEKGDMVQEAKDQACLFMQKERAKECIVVLCPPPNMFITNKAGTCTEVSCVGRDKATCLKETLNAPLAALGRTVWQEKGKTGGVTLSPEGVSGGDFLSKVLSEEGRKRVAEEIRAMRGDENEEAIDKILKIINEGSAPCTPGKDEACTPIIRLNKDLAEAMRLDPCKTNPAACGPGTGTERPTLRIPGGAGLPPPPMRQAQQQPPRQQGSPQQQPPLPGSQFSQSMPQPTTPCQGGAWQPQYSGAITTGWVCIPSTSGSTITAQTPVAGLSCAPKLVEMGMKVNVSYSCSLGTSAGTGFDTGGKSSGSVDVVIAPSLVRGNTATFGLTCTNQTVSSATQCVVEVVKPAIVLVANPTTVASGASSQLGWVTAGMRSCLISSPSFPDFNTQNATNTSPNGAARTPALTTTTDFVLTCTTLTNTTRAATTTVQISNTASAVQQRQLAAGALAVGSPASPLGKPKAATEKECNAGQVQTLKQEKKGAPPQLVTSTCFEPNEKGDMVQAKDADKNEACTIMRKDMAQQCLVKFCPPDDALRKGVPSGTCFVVSCGKKSGKECLNETLAKLEKPDGAIDVAGRTYGINQTAAAFARKADGSLYSFPLRDAFDRDKLAAKIRENVPKNDASFSKIIDFADKVEKEDRLPHVFKPNDDLDKAYRLSAARKPPGPGAQQGPGTQGLQTPDNTGFKFPNIHKDPSGTDVLAWMRHLGSKGKGDQPGQQGGGGGGGQSASPLPGAGASAQQPPPSQCEGGAWKAVSEGGRTVGWKCVRTRIVSYKAIPEKASKDQTVNIGWFTEGMKDCDVTSSNFPVWMKTENESTLTPNGVAKTPALETAATFDLTCTNEAGEKLPPRTLTVDI